MIPLAAFGNTGHQSSRVIFGAAALGAMSQDAADRLRDLLLEFGVNHIDTAAAYGDSELRIGPWMREYRKTFFVATKTGDRGRDGARDSIHRSLDRLRTDHVDLIQLHNLAEEEDWQRAMGPGGALEALAEARDRGLTRFIGVTGHGSRIAATHRRSLERFAFDAVLFPYNFTMMSIPSYAAEVETLIELCTQRGVAMQTIKSAARRRWQNGSGRKLSWYEPLRDKEALRRAVHYTLSRPGLFLNSSSDATLLPDILAAASEPPQPPPHAAMESDVAAYAMEPLFIPGLRDRI